jgi:general secretion pathway protein A
VARYLPQQGNAETAVAGETLDKPAEPAAPVPVVAEVDAIALPQALPDTLTWPAGEERSRSKDTAYSALFLAWGAQYQGKDACRQAGELGLRCLSSRSGLAELRQFDRPVILHLRDELGQEFHATLTALDADSATFSVGSRTEKVALGALAAQWSGHYTMLVRMPPDAYRNIRPGERGPSVQWLGKLLSQAMGKEADIPAHLVFDAALVRQVRQFQLAEGLVPDGAIGPQTLTRLISVADQNAPRLSGHRGEG